MQHNITHRISGYIVGNMWMPQSVGGIPCSENLRNTQKRFVNDLVNSALREINYYEIAKAYVSEVDKETVTEGE